MKILMEGSIPEPIPEPTYLKTIVCDHCSTMFEFDIGDIWTDILRYDINLHVHCPLCNIEIFVADLYDDDEIEDIDGKAQTECMGTLGGDRIKEERGKIKAEDRKKEFKNGCGCISVLMLFLLIGGLLFNFLEYITALCIWAALVVICLIIFSHFANRQETG